MINNRGQRNLATDPVTGVPHLPMDVTEAIARRCERFVLRLPGARTLWEMRVPADRRTDGLSCISRYAASSDWTPASYRGLRSIGKTGGHDPALMTPSLSKPWRSYRGIFLALVLSR